MKLLYETLNQVSLINANRPYEHGMDNCAPLEPRRSNPLDRYQLPECVRSIVIVDSRSHRTCVVPLTGTNGKYPLRNKSRSIITRSEVNILITHRFTRVTRIMVSDNKRVRDTGPAIDVRSCSLSTGTQILFDFISRFVSGGKQCES
jgi:hypothetical protein